MGRCPRCGQGKLFRGVAQFDDHCASCGLDFAGFNVGDGPAAFLILILGGVITGLAIWLELALSPPWWLHILLWVPLTGVAVVYCLRAGKALLLAQEYRQQAREGRIADRRQG